LGSFQEIQPFLMEEDCGRGQGLSWAVEPRREGGREGGKEGSLANSTLLIADILLCAKNPVCKLLLAFLFP
jgi:hypothetical protein